MLCPECHEIPKANHTATCDPFRDPMRDYEPWEYYSPIYELMSFFKDLKEYRTQKQDLKKKELELFDREERLKILERIAVEEIKKAGLIVENDYLQKLIHVQKDAVKSINEATEKQFDRMTGILKAGFGRKSD